MNAAPGPIPLNAPQGQPYGAAGVQLAAQRAVPMAPQPVPGGPTPGGASQGGPLPGVVPFDRPSERPGEHVMTGVPVGPGAGTSAVPILNQPQPPASRVSDLLGRVAESSGIQALGRLADQARSLGQ